MVKPSAFMSVGATIFRVCAGVKHRVSFSQQCKGGINSKMTFGINEPSHKIPSPRQMSFFRKLWKRQRWPSHCVHVNGGMFVRAWTKPVHVVAVGISRIHVAKSLARQIQRQDGPSGTNDVIAACANAF